MFIEQLSADGKLEGIGDGEGELDDLAEAGFTVRRIPAAE